MIHNSTYFGIKPNRKTVSKRDIDHPLNGIVCLFINVITLVLSMNVLKIVIHK